MVPEPQNPSSLHTYSLYLPSTHHSLASPFLFEPPFLYLYGVRWASQVALVVKNLLANAGDMRLGFNPWVGRSPAGGRGNPFQYACLENPMDRGAWRATVRGVTNSRTGLKRLSTQSLME